MYLGRRIDPAPVPETLAPFGMALENIPIWAIGLCIAVVGGLGLLASRGNAMRIFLKVLWSTLGFTFGMLVSLIMVELVRYGFAEYHGNYYRPMDSFRPGILIGGIVTGIVGWRTAPTPEGISRIVEGFSQPIRYWIAGTVCWMLLLLILVFGIDLFGRYWYASEWRKFWIILLGPPLLGLVAILLFRWARNGRQRQDQGTQ
jgi:hypothetical protein